MHRVLPTLSLSITGSSDQRHFTTVVGMDRVNAADKATSNEVFSCNLRAPMLVDQTN